MSLPHPSDRRKAISGRLRFEILRRDNHTCRYCHATDTPLTIDHVTPVVLGGTDDPSNLVAACKDCNAGKSSSAPDAATVAQVSQDAVRWAVAVREAAQDLAAKHQAQEDRLGPFLARWDELVPSYRRTNPRFRLPFDWQGTVIGILDAGLPEEQLLHAVEIALGSHADNAFRYMVGVASEMSAGIHARARQILEQDED